MRSRWKNSYLSVALYRAVVYLSGDKNSVTKQNMFSIEKRQSLSSRSTSILPFLLHKILWVHDGRKYRSVYITPSMFGHKLGSFITTRVRCVYKRKKKKKNKKKNKK